MLTETRPLRIAFRIGTFPTLTETFILSQLNGMAARGHRVSVLADHVGSVGTSSSTAAQSANLHRIGSTGSSNPLLASIRERLPYRIRRSLKARVERSWSANHDVFVCNFGWFGASLAHALKNGRNRARIVTIFHGDDLSRTLQGTSPDFYQELFEEADLLLPISDFWRNRLLEMAAPPHKIAVHHMGVDLAAPIGATRPMSGPSRRLITVGRLVEKKGTEFLLRAFALLLVRRPDLQLKLDIVGEGPLEVPLKALQRELGVGDRVDFVGALPHRRVKELLSEADLFVLPSVTAMDGDMEGIPVSLMEAMAIGLPVVSTRHSGIPELVEHGVNGLLAAERDPVDLCEQLDRMLSDDRARDEFRQAAREKIEREFDNEVLNDRLERMLLDLTMNKNRTPGLTPHGGLL